jgi:HEPN domain-containing protein
MELSFMREVKSWMYRAEHDLNSAKKLLSGDDPIPDTAIYHTQQCAEKILKAFLCLKKSPIPKTHDVELLVELATELEQSFNQLIEYAEFLTPYATAFRYPGIELDPGIQDVKDAIKMSEYIFKFTIRYIDLKRE